MSHNPRRSYGLGRIFSRPDIQPTPNKRPTPTAATGRQKQARTVLEDDLWDGNTPRGTHAGTPTVDGVKPHRSLKGARDRTPQTPGCLPEIAEIASEVYSFLADAGFEEHTGVSLPKNPAQSPMNTDIVKMFNFLLNIALPFHRSDATIIEMLDDLGYPDLDNSFRRNFSTSHVMANTPSMWPKILRALGFVAQLIELGRTIEISSNPDPENESDWLEMIYEEYACFQYLELDGSTALDTLNRYLRTAENQIYECAENMDKIASHKKEVEETNAMVIQAKQEYDGFCTDIAKLEGYLDKKPLEIAAMNEQLENINVQLVTQREMLVELERQKAEYALSIEKAGVSLSTLEDCEFKLMSLQEDLDGLRAKTPGLESQAKALRERLAVSKRRTMLVLEQVCDEMGETIPEENEWPEAVLELFSRLDGQRRDLMLRAAAIQEASISEKIQAAAFNSIFASTQSKQVRLEGVVKAAKDQNAFRVRELEIKQAVINNEKELMESHWAEIKRESQLEHSHTREEQLKAKHEGVKLDGKAQQSVRAITAKTRSKLQQFDKIESMLLPGIRQLGTSADEYAKTASQISKRAAQFKMPGPLQDRGTKEERVNGLMYMWEKALKRAASEPESD